MFIKVELGTTLKKEEVCVHEKSEAGSSKSSSFFPITPWNIFECFSRIAGCQKKKKTQMELAKKELLLMNQ